MDPNSTRVRAEADPGGPAAQAHDLAREVVEARDALGRLLDELERRRRELGDVRLQLRRHAGPIVATGGALVAVAAGGVALSRWRARRRRAPGAQARRIAAALGRAIAHPERVARPSPTLGRKLLAAVLTTLATLAIKQVAGRALGRGTKHA